MLREGRDAAESTVQASAVARFAIAITRDGDLDGYSRYIKTHCLVEFLIERWRVEYFLVDEFTNDGNAQWQSNIWT